MRAFFAVVLAVALGVSSAFAPSTRLARSAVTMSAEPEARREFMSKAAAGVAAFGAAAPAFADRDYEGIKYLGGGDKIDLNNANIRAYLRIAGMYPNAAGKIASNNTPLKSVSDVYNIKGLTEAEKAVIKKNEARFVVLEPKPEYVIDRMNNGLYR
jgi:photosystem II PsbU protein